MSDKQFYVIGGEYADTSFTKPVPGTELETHGPFTEQEARIFWRTLTGQTVDNAMVRYVVKAAAELQGDNFYVVGGEYADASFTVMAAGKAPESYGPFGRQQAMDFWRGITSQTVDSALHRYEIIRK
ncbi:MAG: DUF4170 domain-containing protein [Rhodospirillaceae bacterium]